MKQRICWSRRACNAEDPLEVGVADGDSGPARSGGNSGRGESDQLVEESVRVNTDVSGNMITEEEAVREVTFTREGVIQLLQTLPRRAVYIEESYPLFALDVKGRWVMWADVEELIRKVREA